MNNQYQIIKLIVLLTLLSSCDIRQENTPPNIVIFLADDLGYADVKWNNPGAYIETPNLDDLAEKGAILTDCYSASSMCSPSRAGLLFGRVPTRIGIHDWIKEIYKKPLSNVHLPSNELTFAEVLKEVGYKTAIIGKWHLNNEFNSGNHSDPDDQGFDYWYCTPVQSNPTHKNPENFFNNGIAVGPTGSDDVPVFSSDIVADRSIEWINTLGLDDQFLLFVPYHEPHVVCDAPDELKKKYLDRIAGGKIPLIEGTSNGLGQAEYYACVENMDQSIGKILSHLDERKQLKNTLVLFSSDNGPDLNRRYQGRLQSVGETGNLSGRKRWILEGGIKQDKPLHWHFHAPRGGPQSVLRKENWVITAQWDKEFKRGRFDVKEIRKIKSAELIDFKLYCLLNDLGQNHDIKE